MRGGLLASNFTTSAITVAGVRGLCRVGAPRWPVLEATIASAHQVRSLWPRACVWTLLRWELGAPRAYSV